MLAAVIRTSDHVMSPSFAPKVQPAQADDLIKQGKAPAAEAIAPTATDAKLVSKLARDARKGVRMALLANPNLTPDDYETILKRSMRDADDQVALAAGAHLDSDRLLGVVADYVSDRWKARPGGTVPGIAKHGGLTMFLLEKLPQEGLPLLQKMHSHGIRDYAYHLDDIPSVTEWYQPGMLTWMAPEMEAPELAWLLAGLLAYHAAPSLEDIKAVAEVFDKEEDPSRTKSARRGTLQSGTLRLCEESVRTIVGFGPSWHHLLYRGADLPEAFQHLLVDELLKDPQKRGRARLFGGPDVPAIYRTHWDPDLSDEPEEVRNHDAWLAPAVVDKLAEASLEQIYDYADQMRTSQDVSFRFRLTASSDIASHVAYVRDLVGSVAPHRRRELAPETVLCVAVRTHHGNYTSSEGFRAWLQGELVAKPTPEKVAELVLPFMGSSAVTPNGLIRDIASSGRVSLLLGGVHEHLKTLNSDTAGAVHLLFQHYFGNNPDAWSLALDLGADWSDSIDELARTVCAASGIEIPTEVVDLVDLQEEDEDAQGVEEFEDSPTAAEDTPDVEEPDTVEGESSDESGSAGSEAKEEVDITDPVMFTLF